jgi:hypothetical protein
MAGIAVALTFLQQGTAMAATIRGECILENGGYKGADGRSHSASRSKHMTRLIADCVARKMRENPGRRVR